MKLIKDGKVIEATEKVYNLIYKHRGFKIYNPDTHLLAYLEREINKVGETKIVEEVKKINLEPTIDLVEDDLSLEELTVKALTEIALEKGIEVPKKIKKAELIQLIREG